MCRPVGQDALFIDSIEEKITLRFVDKDFAQLAEICKLKIGLI